jgi:hypothetical protein
MSTVSEKLWPREFEGKRFVANYLWDTNTLSWVRETTNSGTGTGAEVQVTNFPAVQAISATSLPLPAGASTSALQTTGNASLTTLITNLLELIASTVPNISYVSTLVTVTTAATKLPATNLTGRKNMIIFNDSGANIFHGPAGVTATTGVRIANQTAAYLTVGPAIDVYAIRASGSGPVIVQEIS